MAGTTLNGATGAPEVELKQIRENPAALREVDKENDDYILLVESVKLRGVLNPIVVRKMVDPETSDEFYGLVDGLHRYSAAQDAGLKTIPVRIIDADEMEALEAQIITNAHRVVTKPVEFTRGIQRLMSANPLLTITELATKKLGMSTTWVSERLGLLKLAEPIQKLVDDGKITLANAYALAKLKDVTEQNNFLERAMTMQPAEFLPTVQTRVKEINDAKRQGRAPKPEGWPGPVPFVQKLGDLKAEFDHPAIGPFLHKELAPNAGPDFDEGFRMGIAWVLHMDPKSAEAQKQKWEQDQEAEKEKKKKLAAERAQKKAEAAQKAAADAKAALETAATA